MFSLEETNSYIDDGGKSQQGITFLSRARMHMKETEKGWMGMGPGGHHFPSKAKVYACTSLSFTQKRQRREAFLVGFKGKEKKRIAAALAEG